MIYNSWLFQENPVFLAAYRSNEQISEAEHAIPYTFVSLPENCDRSNLAVSFRGRFARHDIQRGGTSLVMVK